MRLFDLIHSQALRSSLDLEPIDGPLGRIFPPTYGGFENDGADRKGDTAKTAHLVEKLADGTLRVLIDSVASQANRQEAALVAARNCGLIDFADVYVDLRETKAGLERLSATEMPHRLSGCSIGMDDWQPQRFGRPDAPDGAVRLSRLRLHFIPAYCPHLNPIERLWGAMHKHVTHNKCYATSREFAGAVLTFLREKVPQNWTDLRDAVTDNFRVVNPKDFRVLA